MNIRNIILNTNFSTVVSPHGLIDKTGELN